jgi:hypothetical protein
MDFHFATAEEPATPEYILAAFREYHRHACASYHADPHVVLDMNTTVGEWIEASHLDDMTWWSVGRCLNSSFEIHGSKAEWREVLVPTSERRLADMCAFVAAHHRRPRIRPAKLLGTECMSAGAFLTIRALLHQAGAPAERIGPSTELADFIRDYSYVFFWYIGRLAPGVMPPIVVDRQRKEWAILCGVGSGLLGGLFSWTNLPDAAWAAWSRSLLHFLRASFFCPAQVSIGDLRTFRDLAVLLAEGDME